MGWGLGALWQPNVAMENPWLSMPIDDDLMIKKPCHSSRWITIWAMILMIFRSRTMPAMLSSLSVPQIVSSNQLSQYFPEWSSQLSIKKSVGHEGFSISNFGHTECRWQFRLKLLGAWIVALPSATRAWPTSRVARWVTWFQSLGVELRGWGPQIEGDRCCLRFLLEDRYVSRCESIWVVISWEMLRAGYFQRRNWANIPRKIWDPWRVLKMSWFLNKRK